MLRPEGLLPDCQGQFVEWFSIGIAALVAIQKGQVAEAGFYWAPFVIVGEGGVPDPALSVQ